MGGWCRPNDYGISKEGLVYQCWMITGWVGGVQKGQNIDYVIYGWSLSVSTILHYAKQ